MNELESYLKENNLTFLDDNSPYTHPVFTNEDRFFKALDDIIENDLEIVIFGDCDIDGLMCLKQFPILFNKLGYSQYNIWKYRLRVHSIDQDCVYECIKKGCKYFIALDIGTNDIETMNKLITFGITPIIIDHHTSDYTFDELPKEAIIVNSRMDNQFNGTNYNLSAGALVFSLLYKYASNRRLDLKQLSAYALISLYSDSMNMADLRNKTIYNMATSLPTVSLPYFITSILGRQVFRRRFIEFFFAPKINSAFRSEKLDLINKYFLEERLSAKERSYYYDEIVAVYEERRELLNQVIDLVRRQPLENFVIADLGSSEYDCKAFKLYNDTGVVASSLASEYGKPCVVLCDTGEEIKGSFRDVLGRNYLPLFKQICKCGGHPSAFGIHIPYQELDDFLYTLKNIIDTNFSIDGVEDVIEIDHAESSPSTELISRVALYNEFSGIGVPIAVIKKRNLFKEQALHRNSRYYKYIWGDTVVESPHKLVTGAYIKIKPVVSISVRLIAYVRG